MSDTDGGPAFPLSGEYVGQDRTTGMSLRDYFAAHAVAALQLRLTTGDAETETRAIANYAGRIADAMIAERDQEPEP